MIRMSTRLLLLGFTLMMLLPIACPTRPPVKIGYVGGLSGRNADLGLAGLNGVTLAVEQQNRQGGIQGRPIKLIVKDDCQQTSVARKVDEELVQAGVVAIIGHMTSAMSVIGTQVANQSRIPMISPTTSANSLDGIDDYFLRVYPANAQIMEKLAQYVHDQMGFHRVSVVYDSTNREHTESSALAFEKFFTAKGGRLTAMIPFRSRSDLVFMDLAERLNPQDFDCLFILANAMDTAMLCQQLHKLGRRPQLLSTDWSVTEKSLEFGADTMEGMFFIHSFDKSGVEPPYLAYRTEYRERFSEDPDFAATLSYEAARVAFQALQQDGPPSRLKETILQIQRFQGLQCEIIFDKTGDIQRRLFPFKIQDGHFVPQGQGR